MATEPSDHIIISGEKMHKSLQNMVIRLAADSYYILTRPSCLGTVAIYFTNRPAIDLAPAVEEVFAQHRATHPCANRNFVEYGGNADEIKAWRKTLRDGLRAAIEPITPLNYRG